jgi:cell division septation protein DedD
VKERLTGAIILVALMVLLVPELLTGPIRSAPRAAALASASGGGALRSYTIDLADENHAHGTTAPASGPQPPAPLPTAAPADSASANGSAEAPGTSNSPTPATAASGATAESTPDSPTPPPGATGATSTGSTNAGGSASPRGSAGSAGSAKSAGSATGAGGARGAAEDGSGAWIVQLGSFTSRANAEHLAQQVRSQGFQVSVSQSSSGRRLYRVRVGAARDHAAALALANKLRALGHSGTVLPRQGGA